jgi:type IV pilus assembly protein PilW
MPSFGGIAGHASTTRKSAVASGFSLVEVMVAMVIALLGILVMTQVFSLFEGQRRTTSGGDDAITAGGIALYGVQRDIQQSGWGISALQLIGCTVTGAWGPASGAAGTGPTVAIPLAPVTINSGLIPAGDPNTDTLLIMSGNSNGTVEGDIIKSVSGAVPPGFVVTVPVVFAAGDRIVNIPTQIQPTPCAQPLGLVGAISSTNVITGDTTTVASTVQGPRLFNLGPAPKVIAYAVRNGKLTVCDYTTFANPPTNTVHCGSACTAADSPAGTIAGGSCNAAWLPLASDIVSMRAQYGRDTTDGNAANPALSMDGVADVWDQTVATPTTTPPVSASAAANTQPNTISCGLIRVSAIRLVMVARSNQPEKAPGGVHVTAATPVWAGSDTTTLTSISAAAAAAVAIDLTATRPDTTTWPTWQDFRYKMFETTVPIRNITSLGAVDGC